MKSSIDQPRIQNNSDFGPLGIGLTHELAGSVTSALMNLEQLNESLFNIRQIIRAAQNHIGDSGQLRWFDVLSQVSKLISETNRRSSDAPIFIDIPVNLRIRGNLLKFKLIISNTVGNAIESYEKNINNKVVTIKARQLDDGVEINITDRGVGFKVNKYFHTQKSRKGNGHMGMGLNITKYLVENDFKGKFIIKSRIGRGTTCIITLHNNLG